MANPSVIDISHHQPDPIDWGRIKNGGTIGVIHKATEGTGYADPKLKSRMAAAKSAGLLISTYHFLRPGLIEDQMDWYLATVDPVQGERVCLDHEDSGVSLSELVKAVTTLLSLRPDLQVTIYSGHLIKEQLGSGYNDTLAQKTSLWIAQYTSASAPDWPTGTWKYWSLWQFSDTGSADGISGHVDCNRFNGTDDALRRWLAPVGSYEPGPEPAPGPEPTDDVIYVDVNVGTVPVGIEVKVRVNGQDT